MPDLEAIDREIAEIDRQLERPNARRRELVRLREGKAGAPPAGADSSTIRLLQLTGQPLTTKQLAVATGLIRTLTASALQRSRFSATALFARTVLGGWTLTPYGRAQASRL